VDGLESNPGTGEFSTPVQTGPEAQPASYKTGTGTFPGVKRPRRGVNPHPHLAPRVKNEQSFISAPLCAYMASYLGELYLYLFLYSMYDFLLLLFVFIFFISVLNWRY
jgi:hypothetical protein